MLGHCSQSAPTQTNPFFLIIFMNIILSLNHMPCTQSKIKVHITEQQTTTINQLTLL